MSSTYNTGIVLSHRLVEPGMLSPETIDRTDEAIRLYLDGQLKSITLSGGMADPQFGITHAQVMADYTHARMDNVRLYLEDQSLDTVGQAFFTKQKVVLPRRMENILVISSDYHIERVKKIFEKIYGPNFNVGYHDIAALREDMPAMIENEKQSLAVFDSMFGDIEAGDDEGIWGVLVSQHPLYNERLPRKRVSGRTAACERRE